MESVDSETKKLFVGTSGWAYRSWEGSFYPERLPKTRQFEFYSSRFGCVEINATFYRLPSQRMIDSWSSKAPEGFKFAVKGSRFITHIKRLKDVNEPLSEFIRRVKPLGSSLGPVLWQLPPSLKFDAQRLDAFLQLLPREFGQAVEFRDPSWLNDETFQILDRYNASCVTISSMAMPADYTVTGSFAYLRFHGLEGGFKHDYSEEELSPFAEFAREQLSGNRTVYAFFNNDAMGRAPKNAQKFIEMIEMPGTGK
ncbi:MAG: DUF72 domain-containing protein [Verrucomicrobia bacterium]|nr:DUF72 domain-containing protein [Verrucomicrobiota bacterium]MCF7708809.1 DUF72 domain-containing protein [Verrucomicrobiota bacterium]